MSDFIESLNNVFIWILNCHPEIKFKFGAVLYRQWRFRPHEDNDIFAVSGKEFAEYYTSEK